MPYLIIAIVMSVMSAGATWKYQSSKYELIISKNSLELSRLAYNQLEKAHAETIRLQSEKDKALADAAKRQGVIIKELNGARTAIVGLSDAADSALQLSHSSHEACTRVSTTLRAVFGECSTTLLEVGEAADRHVSDIKTLTY